MSTSERGGVLILGDYPIGYPNGIGETLANLFMDVPDRAIVQAHPSHLQPLPGQGRGTAVGFDVPRRPAAIPSWAGPAYYPVFKLRQARAERALFDQAADLIRTHDIRAVLTYPVTPWLLFAAVRLRRAFPRVRFVFYVMDDWEGHHTCFGLPFTAKRRAALAEMVATADVRFACSHLMKLDYEERFGTPWHVLHKGVPRQLAQAPSQPRRPFTRILYTGAMNMFRFDAVLAFAEGLRLFREHTGRDVALTLLGPTPDPEYAAGLAPYRFIHTEPWVDNATCQRRMAEADLLYLPLSFAPKLERIANLAMPTKLSEYLASGRPTIFHVPRESEVHRLASTAGLPLTLDTLDPGRIRDFLSQYEGGGFDVDAYQRVADRLLQDEFDEVTLGKRLQDACFPNLAAAVAC